MKNIFFFSKNTVPAILIFCACFAVSIFPACEGTESCPLGDPTPMFSDGLALVNYHDFKQEGQKSVEDVSFSTGVDLQILQEGCENVQQEFRFTVKGNMEGVPDSLWLKEAVKQFYFLSALGKKQKPLEMWGDAIDQARGGMKLGQSATLAPGIKATVDKVLGQGESTLLVLLESGADQ